MIEPFFAAIVVSFATFMFMETEVGAKVANLIEC
jgi:hypothetical protein